MIRYRLDPHPVQKTRRTLHLMSTSFRATP